MVASLEQISRPSASVQADGISYPTIKKGSAPVLFTILASGTPKVLNGSYELTATVYNRKKPKEQGATSSEDPFSPSPFSIPDMLPDLSF
jgi:hypothetical protein